MINCGPEKSFIRENTSICVLFLILFINFYPCNVSAQIGLKLPPLGTYSVNFEELRSKSTGLGLGIYSNPIYSIRSNFIKRTTVLDTVTNSYVITERINGRMILPPYVMQQDSFITKGRRVSFENMWRESVLSTVSSSGTQARSEGLKLSIPIPMQNKALRAFTGGGGLSLAVTGDVSIKGNLIKNDRSQVKSTYQGSDYTFKLEQTQMFHIKGMVGEKISVLVDQNSERPIDLENNIRLYYTGEEDEIFKSIEAGNVSLALPGTQFITFSGANKGLFGFKMSNQIGGFNLTSIASLERGEKQSLKLKGGAKAQSQIIHDYNYLEGMYFFIDDYYYENFRYDSNLLIPLYTPGNEIENLELWLSKDRDYLNTESEEAWAVADPENFQLNDSTDVDQDHVKQFFMRLEANVDYFVFKDLGYIRMNRMVRESEVLAVAYTSVSGKEVGHLNPPSFYDPNDSSAFVLKLLRTKSPHHEDKSWRLEWRNVYDLGSSLSSEGLEISIVLNTSTDKTPVQEDGKSFIEVFGLDRVNNESGSMTPDDIVDSGRPGLVDFSNGHLILPGQRPFDPKDPKDDATPMDPFTGGDPLLLEKHRIPDLYDKILVNTTDKTEISQFDIMVKSSNASSEFRLPGFNIIEGSEEVFLNGQQLTRGVHYEIDYFGGTINILDTQALQQGADLEIKYESADILQFQKKTMYGSRLEYNFDDGSFFGASALFLNERVVQERVSLGQEPKKNLVWGVNARIQKESKLLSSIIDKLPLIKAIQPSNFVFETEFAQSKPNPNTLNNAGTNDNLGVADLDNFEGTQRKNYLGISRKEWTISSRPFYYDSFGVKKQMENTNRAKLNWYNPYEQINIKQIFPNKDTNSRTKNQVNVLNLRFLRDSRGNFPDNPWGGVMKALTPGYYNQTENKFVEIWIKGDSGTVYIDLGLISEDALDDGKNANFLNSEDLIISTIPNGILDEGEDVGLDGISAKDGTNDEELFDDDWAYSDQADLKDYTDINGTEGNGTGDKIDGVRLPDTEDINGNGSLDQRNDFFQYVIHLGDDHPVSSKYIAGGLNRETGEKNEFGWRLYRIPLKEYVAEIGAPNFSRVEYARFWMKNFAENQIISVYSIDLVGNKWLEEGIAENDTLVMLGEYVGGDSTLFVEVVNTEENSDEYVSPPGVEGEVNQLTQARAREQSLQFRFIDLAPNQSAAIKQTFIRDQDLIHYRYLKFYVYGDKSLVSQDTTYIQFYMQIGRDKTNYYEIRKKLYKQKPDDPSLKEAQLYWNEVIIDLWELPKIKNDDVPDTLDVSDTEQWRVYGLPSLTSIRHILIGVKNLADFDITGKIWIDELRVSEVDKSQGKAFRANAAIKISDLATFSINYSKLDADFHTLNEKFGQGTNSTNLSLSSTFNVERLFTPLKSFNIPINYMYRSSSATPKWFRGSDIIYSPDMKNAEAEKISNQSTSIQTSIAKITKSNRFLIRNTLDLLKINYQRNFTKSRDLTNEINDKTTQSGGVTYGLTFPATSVQVFKFLGQNKFVKPVSDIKINFFPGNISTGMNANQINSKIKLRKGTLKETAAIKGTRNISSRYVPSKSLSFDYSRSTTHDLKHVKDPFELISEIFNDTTKLSTNQRFGGSFKPSIMEWLSPNFRYTADYSVSRNRQSAGSGNMATSNRNITSGVSFSFQKIVNKIYTPEKKAVTAQRAPGRRVPGRVTPPAEQPPPPEEQKQEEDKKEGIKFNPLHYIELFSSKLAPIKIDYTKKKSIQSSGLKEEPGLGFQFGFADDPGVDVYENLGKNTGGLTDADNISLSSRLNITNNVGITFSFDNNKSTNNRGNTKTGTISHTLLVIKDKKLMLPRYSISIGNLQKLFFLSKLANNIKYRLSYNGSKAESWQGASDNIINTKYNWRYSPLAGFDISWKGGISSTISLDRNTTLSINQYGAEQKTLNNGITISTKFSWNTGFRIPIPIGFLRNKRIKNSVTFNLQFKQSANKTLNKELHSTDFQVKTETKNWNIQPTLTYSFNQRVAGSMFFQYTHTENTMRGTDNTKNFGLQVNIKIAG